MNEVSTCKQAEVVNLGEVQRVSFVNKCKRFQKANKELIVAAGDTQRGVFQHHGHNQIRARK